MNPNEFTLETRQAVMHPGHAQGRDVPVGRAGTVRCMVRKRHGGMSRRAFFIPERFHTGRLRAGSPPLCPRGRCDSPFQRLLRARARKASRKSRPPVY